MSIGDWLESEEILVNNNRLVSDLYRFPEWSSSRGYSGMAKKEVPSSSRYWIGEELERKGSNGTKENKGSRKKKGGYMPRWQKRKEKSNLPGSKKENSEGVYERKILIPFVFMRECTKNGGHFLKKTAIATETRIQSFGVSTSVWKYGVS